MASEKDVLIQQLHQVENLLAAQKKEGDLSTDDWKIYSVAEKYFGKKYFFKKSYSKSLKNLPISAVRDYINELEKEKEEEETKQKKQEEQGASIPPELEALVAEYQENLALLESEEIKSSSQKTVAAQVKIAIAHSKIRALVQANRNRRTEQGEKFQNQDDVLVSLGSPRSGSATAALSNSYTAVKMVAFSYSGFTQLSPQLQNEIITSAVELNTVGIRDIDTAIQAATLQVDISALEDSDRNNLATIPGGFVSTVYQQVVDLDKQTEQYHQRITTNEQAIAELQAQFPTLSESERIAKSLEIKVLVEENDHLSTSIEADETRFNDAVSKQTESFKDYEEGRKSRLSDPKYADIQDRIELANKEIAKIHKSLEDGGVKPHIYTPMDDARLLEQAIRHDMPGVLRQYATYEAAEAATIINDPKLQSRDLSPASVLLFGKDLTPKLLAEARKFAKDHPESSLGKLFATRKDIFDAAGVQLRKISISPLGKEISKAATGIGKAIKPISGFFGKISDKLGGFGGVVRIVSNPWAALRSWAGRKAGQVVLRQITKYLTNATLKKGAEMVLKQGLKKAAAELVAKAVAKAAIKLGAKLAVKGSLELAAQAANVVPGLGILIAVVIDILWWMAEKAIALGKKISIALYGEEVKARDLLVVPAAGAAAAAGAVFTFFAVISTATIVAAGSAVAILVISGVVVIFFYLTSIATAPLISTLVQLDSTPKTSFSGPIMPGCPTIQPFSGSYLITQGPKGIGCTHYPNTEAVDYGTPMGTPIVSITDGVVSFAGPHPSTYGNLIIINATTTTGISFQIYYAHLSDIIISAGDNVQAGMPIGATGNSGGWAPHLHLEYRGIPYNSCPAGGQVVTEGCCMITAPGCGYTN